ncbi:MAG: Trm112 family protein [Leptospirales bacterium]
MSIDPFLLSILVCPQCKGELKTTTTPEGLACPVCHLLYPIKEEIPVMLVEEALPYTAAPSA